MNAFADHPLMRTVAGVIGDGAIGRSESVLALVSGGADSMTLLNCLVELHAGPVHVLTIDHGLRADAHEECALVETSCARLGVPVHRATLQLEPGAAMQDRAREARWREASAHARRVGADVIATGHTATDHAETVLMRIARGAGPPAVAAMSVRDGNIARPLLHVTRAEVRAWCREHRIDYVDDPANDDLAFARVRARRMLESLESVSPGAEAHLCQFARILHDEAKVVGDAADDAQVRCARGSGLDPLVLIKEPVALQRVLLRRLLGDAEVPEDGRGFAVVEAIRRELPEPPRRDLPGGKTVLVESGVLQVLPQFAVRDVSDGLPAVTLTVPGQVEFGGKRLHARIGVAGPRSPHQVGLRSRGTIEVRGPRAGDRIATSKDGRTLVGKLLAEAGVPARLRHRVPLVSIDGRIVWVAGYRAAHDARAPAGTSALVIDVEDA